MVVPVAIPLEAKPLVIIQNKNHPHVFKRAFEGGIVKRDAGYFIWFYDGKIHYFYEKAFKTEQEATDEFYNIFKFVRRCDTNSKKD